MKTNKDTIKAIESVATLIKYCDRYTECKGCIFRVRKFANIYGCAINYPFQYKEVMKND